LAASQIIKEDEMKTRKAIFALLTVCCLMSSFPMATHAAQIWAICTIDQVGPYGINEGVSGSHIYLTDTANSPAWDGSKKFLISSQRGKEFLATALTAVANGKTVNASVNPDATVGTVGALIIQK
jgi:hypothetical protein